MSDVIELISSKRARDLKARIIVKGGRFLKNVSIFALAILATGCSENSVPTNEAANQLEQAAEQSDPAARQVLQDEAADLRNNGHGLIDPAAPDGHVQQALENASNASAQPDR